jgi:hypothetical protein
MAKQLKIGIILGFIRAQTRRKKTFRQVALHSGFLFLGKGAKGESSYLTVDLPSGQG